MFISKKKIMKHLKKRIQNQYKKIPKSIIKKGTVFVIILLFGMTMLFQKDTWNTEMQFVWNMDETFIHNAPNTQRDYLFENEGGEEIYQWTLTWTIDTTIDITPLINTEEIENILDELQEQTGTTQTGGIYSGTIQTITWSTKEIKNTTWSLNCITPRGKTIKNKDFTLAYEQRKDVNTICNIEKRVCLSWELLGSFKQRSCKEDVIYNYEKAEVVSYNQKVLNEYIQPVPPINSWANFNNEWKINTLEIPTTSRWNTNNWIDQDPTVNQITKSITKNCSTPRWQTIQHGQFTKAYKTSRGFINLPCEVELRACVNGELRWDYTYSTCTFNNTTYEDYVTAGSPATNSWFIFFERIKRIFSL